MLQILGQDVGSVRKEVCAEKVAHRVRGEFGEILCQLVLSVSPSEIGVALRETDLRQFLHHFRAGERLAQEDSAGKFSLHLGDDPFPERDGFCVGIVHAENAHAVLAPEKDDIAEFVPEFTPVRIVEIQRIHILVFLRRVLGILDRAIGSLEKPLWMGVHIGMVGRAVDRKIKGDLHAALADFVNKPVEVLERSEFGRDILVSTAIHALLVVSDGIRHTRLAGFALERVVPPFAVAGSDGMNRWKINDIKSHRLRIIDTRQALAECRTRVRLALRRAGKKLIPGGKGSALAIHPHRMKRLRNRGQRAVGIHAHQGAQRGIMREVVGLLSISHPHGGSRFFQSLAIRSLARTGGRRLDEGSSFPNLALEFAKSGCEFFLQFVLPGKKHIPPGLDSVFPSPFGRDAEGRSPSVVLHRSHRRFVPSLLTYAAPLENRGHLVVTLLENVRFHRDLATNWALDGKTGVVQ